MKKSDFKKDITKLIFAFTAQVLNDLKTNDLKTF
jgi:hypothetical protein